MQNKGSALLYTVLILSLLLSVVFGLSLLITAQLDVMRSVGNSTIAFYAADAGIERMLNSFVSGNELTPQDYKFASQPGDFTNGASYDVYIYCKSGGSETQCGAVPVDGSCNAENYCIKSVGNYKNTKRAIMVMI